MVKTPLATKIIYYCNLVSVQGVDSMKVVISKRKMYSVRKILISIRLWSFPVLLFKLS